MSRVAGTDSLGEPAGGLAGGGGSAAGPGRMLEMIATCTFGLEAVVVRELEQLGFEAEPRGTGRVHFRVDTGGDGLDGYRAVIDANLWLRSADRVHIKIGGFSVRGGDPGFDDLFEGVKKLPWERWIAQDAACPVAGRCVRSFLSSEPAVQRATKRAIVDRLREAYAQGGVPALLPETGPEVQIEVAIVNNEATLTIDSSGVGLHKRGYRDSSELGRGGGGGGAGEAAIRETLAAGLVLLSVWRGDRRDRPRPLVDPFCGSGTIVIEAAMLARGIAPGLNRLAGFAAEQWLMPGGTAGQTLIPAELWAQARAEAQAAISPDRLDPPIHASDIDEHALTLARRNAKAAGVERDIHFFKRDVRDIESKLPHGVIVTNPPYGIRLGEEREMEQLYRALPIVFRKLASWTFHIFTGRLDLERLFGQEASRRRKLYNSKIECCYYTFLGPKPVNPEAARALGEPAVHEEQAMPTGGQLDDSPMDLVGQQGEPEAVGQSEATESLSMPTRREPRAAAAPAMATFGGLRERDTKEAADFSRCLANNLRHLRRYPSRGIHAYRVYERDVPDVPLIVDRYSDGAVERYHAVEYEREHSRTYAQQADWFDLMRRTIASTAGVPIEQVVMKEKHRQRGLTQHQRQAELGETMMVSEGDPPGPALKFEVNLSDFIDTGLFLDHRLTRQLVREQSSGKRFLNLFCYTSSFTVYAASGGAATTTSVDLSNTYLDWSARNMERNGFACVGPGENGRHRLVRSDVLAFLRDHPRARGVEESDGVYDLVVVDPPTFSNSKSTTQDWQVQDDHVEMIGLLAPLLGTGASVYFSNNHRKFKLDHDAVARAGFAISELSKRTIPPEYRNKRIHQCWRFTKLSVEAQALSAEARAAAPKTSAPIDQVP